MRILLHTRSTGGGGAERVTATLAAGLAARGHAVVLAVDVVDPAAEPPAGVEVVELPHGHLRAVLRLAALIRRGQDVVVSALALAVVRSALAKAAALSRTPLVISYHGFEENRLGGAGPLAYAGMPVLRQVAARVVCVSDALTAFMVERWGAPAGRTVTLHNPVPLPAFDAPPSPAAGRPPVVAAVGRLSPEKGMTDLLRAFARTRTPDARLIVAGEGPEKAELSRLVDELGLAGRVSFLGWLGDAVALFRGVRVAVVPSRSEAFSLVTVEALAAGAAVVATDCGGPREILEGGRHGLLVPVGDADALAEAIDAALADPGDEAARLARALDFSVERRVDAWEDLLAEVARRGR